MWRPDRAQGEIMRGSLFRAATAAALLWPFAVEAACISAEEAQRHVGENTCVCGAVASAHYVPKGRQPTFLNLDKPYPNQIFTALIWGSDRPKFGEPERTLLDKRICVTGAIELYREKPEIFLHDPAQLSEEGGR
jgi:hypothetical protein